MGWFIAVWLFLGIVGCTIGLAMSLAQGEKIQLGHVACAILGPVVLLAVVCVALEIACKKPAGTRG